MTLTDTVNLRHRLNKMYVLNSKLKISATKFQISYLYIKNVYLYFM